MRRILVTGANKGIGLAIATAILEQESDAFVFIGSRDLRLGRGARRQLVEAHPDWTGRIDVVELDVSSDGSVRNAANWLTEQLPGVPTPLYAIVNNAGIGGGSASLAQILEVNTFGVRRVCEAFTSLLDPQIGRIVNITSAAGPSFVATCTPERQQFLTDPEIEWPKLRAFLDEYLSLKGDKQALAERGLSAEDAYGLSKACANAYTVLLAREHPALRINACTPGFIETDMTRRYAESQGKTPAELGLQPPAAGARTAVFLLFGDPPGNGRYYGSDAQRSPLDRYRAPGSEPYHSES